MQTFENLDAVREYFKNDHFATDAAGAIILEASKGFSRCEMKLEDVHRNATGNVMGGAIFTLADFALAVACNYEEEPTVSISNTIEFLRPTKGSKLIAECTVDRSGKRVGFYTVHVSDDLGKLIAVMNATCAR